MTPKHPRLQASAVGGVAVFSCGYFLMNATRRASKRRPKIISISACSVSIRRPLLVPGCGNCGGIGSACGAAPLIPPIEGLAEGMESGFAVTAEDVITGKAVVREGQKAAVIGSGLTGLETAEFLLSNGRKLDIIEMLPALGPGVFPAILNDEMSRIKPYDPGLFPGHKLTAVHAPAENEPGYITVEDTATAESLDLSADVIILAMGIVPRTALVQAFKEAFGNVYVAGDASQGGRIATATRQGFEAAYTFKA